MNIDFNTLKNQSIYAKIFKENKALRELEKNRLEKIRQRAKREYLKEKTYSKI